MTDKICTQHHYRGVHVSTYIQWRSKMQESSLQMNNLTTHKYDIQSHIHTYL